MIGFTFNNVHSRDMGVVFKSDDRTLLPAKRITQYKIPGKSGTYDIADGYDNRQISCTVAFVIFDDEPEKAYSAKVIDGIGIEQIAVTGHCSVTFLCEPFAESIGYNQKAVQSVSLPDTVTINVKGTQETDGLIYITARGTITNLTVTRLKVN